MKSLSFIVCIQNQLPIKPDLNPNETVGYDVFFGLENHHRSIFLTRNHVDARITNI